jgi:hypothetical protein
MLIAELDDLLRRNRPDPIDLVELLDGCRPKADRTTLSGRR